MYVWMCAFYFATVYMFFVGCSTERLFFLLFPQHQLVYYFARPGSAPQPDPPNQSRPEKIRSLLLQGLP
jgi:hypothetical protein